MVKVFRNEGLLCPSRLRVGDTVVFRPLTAWTATRMLNNPRYAGAYAYGRRQYRRPLDGKKQFRGSASSVTGSLAFRMLIPATSVGSGFKKISKSSRATVAHTNWRARHRRGKERRYCKDALSAVGAEGTSVSDMSRDEAGRKPGMFVIVDTLRVAS